jgi:DNA invertase Pin-like site-specific DNA recombinase
MPSTRRISAARKRAIVRYLLEKVGECIFTLDDYLRMKKGVLVAVVYVRVSTQKQSNNGNLDDQEKRLIDELKARGIQVIVVYREVCAGYCRDERKELIAAIEHAQRENAILVAESLDRLIRPENYEGNRDDNIPLNIQDLEWLKQISGDVPLTTFIAPCFTAYEIRSNRIRGGQERNGRGGRPRKNRPNEYKKRASKEDLQEVLKLSKCGHSVRDIARILERGKSTIYDWLLRSKKLLSEFDPDEE